MKLTRNTPACAIAAIAATLASPAFAADGAANEADAAQDAVHSAPPAEIVVSGVLPRSQ